MNEEVEIVKNLLSDKNCDSCRGCNRSVEHNTCLNWKEALLTSKEIDEIFIALGIPTDYARGLKENLKK